jgi:hypothetical protein
VALKSIIDLDLQDGKFIQFKRLFDEYNKALKSQPAAWDLVTKKIDGSRSAFDKVVAGMVAANVQEKLRVKAQERADQLTRTSADRWASMARTTRTVAGNIKEGTVALLKWSGIIGAVTGLLGAGGIWGIDRLAQGVSAGRRSSLGLGVGYGEQQAFGNFGRLVDSDSFLSAVANAKLDVTKRVGLLGAGLSAGEIGGDTANTSVALLRRLKEIADHTNPQLYAQVIQARRLDQFVSPEDLQRLRNTSGGEFQQLLNQYNQRRTEFDLPSDVQRKWQDFTTQLSNAGRGIETTFVRGLSPLVPGLSKLSDAVQKTISTFLASPALGQWLDKADKGLERFADYVGTPDFQHTVESFVVRIGQLGSAIGSFLSLFGLGGGRHGASVADRANWARHHQEGRNTVGEIRAAQAGGKSRWQTFAEIFTGASPENNPGNLRPPGASTGFQQFGSPEAGVAAMARQLQLYENRDHLDTLSKIISRYAPASENDTGSYIADVSKRTGFGPQQSLNLNDPQVLSAVVAAMINHEQKRGSFDKYKDAKVVVEVLNNTGGNAAVTVNGLKN